MLRNQKIMWNIFLEQLGVKLRSITKMELKQTWVSFQKLALLSNANSKSPGPSWPMHGLLTKWIYHIELREISTHEILLRFKKIYTDIAWKKICKVYSTYRWTRITSFFWINGHSDHFKMLLVLLISDYAIKREIKVNILLVNVK